MGKILALLITVSFLITGCASVDVYTFKKDRVDQKEEGNKGYLKGMAPESQDKTSTPQRTMIGVDIELPGGATSSKETGTRFKKGGEIPESPVKTEISDANIPQPKKKTPKPVVDAKEVSETIVVETVEVETEEDWIK
jgi:hypothetical protein